MSPKIALHNFMKNFLLYSSFSLVHLRTHRSCPHKKEIKMTHSASHRESDSGETGAGSS